MIEEIISNLPYKIGEQLLYEYNRRLSDVNYLTSGKFDYYSSLKSEMETIKTLLALSIFYKRILTNFDSANKFTSRIILKNDADGLKLGTYEMDLLDIRKLNRIVISFKKIMEDYSIPIAVFEYLETKEFLKKVKVYRDNLNREKENGESF